jgi:uncharacterized protein YaeQ
VPSPAVEALGKLAGRSMQLQCTVQEGQVYFSGGEETVQLELAPLKSVTTDD